MPRNDKHHQSDEIGRFDMQESPNGRINRKEKDALRDTDNLRNDVGKGEVICLIWIRLRQYIIKRQRSPRCIK